MGQEIRNIKANATGAYNGHAFPHVHASFEDIHVGDHF